MIFYRYISLLAVIVIFITSCERRSNKTEFEIFDLEQFLSDQVAYLADHKAGLKKRSGIGDSTELIVVEHDSAGWAKELSIFRTADIHKPGLRSYYDKEEYESGSDMVTEYEIQDSSQSETIYLRIIRRKGSDKISEIESLQHTRNPIYNSRRKLTMTFLPAGRERVRLDSFYITGYQKMVTQDSVVFLSNGKVIVSE